MASLFRRLQPFKKFRITVGAIARLLYVVFSRRSQLTQIEFLNLMGLLDGVVQSHPVFRQGTGFAIAA